MAKRRKYHFESLRFVPPFLAWLALAQLMCTLKPNFNWDFTSLIWWRKWLKLSLQPPSMHSNMPQQSRFLQFLFRANLFAAKKVPGSAFLNVALCRIPWPFLSYPFHFYLQHCSWHKIPHFSLLSWCLQKQTSRVHLCVFMYCNVQIKHHYSLFRMPWTCTALGTGRSTCLTSNKKSTYLILSLQ